MKRKKKSICRNARKEKVNVKIIRYSISYTPNFLPTSTNLPLPNLYNSSWVINITQVPSKICPSFLNCPFSILNEVIFAGGCFVNAQLRCFSRWWNKWHAERHRIQTCLCHWRLMPHWSRSILFFYWFLFFESFHFDPRFILFDLY